VANLMCTPRAFFSRLLLHDPLLSESANLLRYGHWKFSKWPPAAILDLVYPEVAPFDPPTPKTLLYNQTWSVWCIGWPVA